MNLMRLLSMCQMGIAQLSVQKDILLSWKSKYKLNRTLLTFSECHVYVSLSLWLQYVNMVFLLQTDWGMLGWGYQSETIFPRDTQEAGEDQGKLIIPRSPLAFILTIVVLIRVASNSNYGCC
jgi:hypothetical protein